MSVEAVTWAWDEAPMLLTEKGKPDTTARSVLAARAERADAQGRNTHAGIEEIIWRTGYDERTIQRAQDRLEAAGLMVPDGFTKWGTPRWNLDMTQQRDPAERAEIAAAIDRRKSGNAARERARRDRQRVAKSQSVSFASTRVDANDTRVDSPSTRVDANDTRVDATPPEPPMNHPRTVLEPPSGGTLPPDPRRPQGPSDLGNEKRDLFYEGDHIDGDLIGNQTTARTREQPSLTLIAGDGDTRDRPERPQRPMWPAPVPDNTPEPAPSPTASRQGFGFCLTCHAEGQITVAVDPVHGDACAYHQAAEEAVS